MKLLKELSAWVPIAMSFAVIVMFTGFFVLAGPPTPEANGICIGTCGRPDEGVAAHVFQLLMAGQIPIVALFAFKWLPKKPMEALRVLALQLLAGVIAASPVFILHL